MKASDPDHKQKRALTYLRVSTREQADRDGDPEGYSIPAQREACARKAESLGASVVAEFVDRGESAKSADRPQLKALLQRVRGGGIDYLIVHKVDRLARNRADDVAINLVLQRCGTQLVSCTESVDETPSGRLLHGIMASIAEFYSQNLAHEIGKGIAQKVQTGGTPGLAPLGYLNRQRDGARFVVVDEVRAPHIRWAYAAYATGEWTQRRLVAELERRGLRTRGTERRLAKPLGISQVQRILTNPYYKGLVVHQGVEYAGKHEPLVPPETWSRVQQILNSRAHNEKERIHNHYLKGTLFCGHCGSRLIVTHTKNRHGHVYPYFICIGRHQKRTDCRLRAQSIDVLEALVQQVYLHISLGSDLFSSTRRLLADELAERRDETKQLRSRLEGHARQLEVQREKLLAAHYAGAVPLDLLKKEQARISHELLTTKTRLEAPAATIESVEATLTAASELARDCHGAYAEAAPPVRRLMNQAFFEKLLVTERGIVGWDMAQPFAAAFRGARDRRAPHPYPGRLVQGVGVHARLDRGRGPGLKKDNLVEAMGLEPTTSCLQSRCSSQLSYAPLRISGLTFRKRS